MRIFHIFLFLLVFSLVTLADDKLDWKPVSAEELSMKTPKVEADADVEAIFWDIDAENKPYSLAEYKQYIRLKIFSEKGVEKYSKLEFPANEFTEDIGVRVINPDGKITEISEKEFFIKEIFKTKYFSVKTKIVPIPNLQVGAILEYQYKQTTTSTFRSEPSTKIIHSLPALDRVASYSYTSYQTPASAYYFAVQNDIPVQQERITVKLDIELEQIQIVQKNFQKNIELKPDKIPNHYYIVLENVPPFKEEPFIPPYKYLKQGIFILKKVKKTLSEDDYYNGYAYNFAWWKKRIREDFGKDEEIKKVAKEVTQNGVTPEEKLHLLYDFCQKQIKNHNYFYSKLSEEEKKKLRKGELVNNPLREIFEKKIGHSGEIRDVFGAMAYTLGFDVTLALGYSRKEYVGVNEKDDIPQMYVIGVGVKLNDQWICLEPANPFLPFGKLYWQYEGQSLLMVDEKTFYFVPILSAPEKNLFKRIADFVLSENGELEGNVRIELNGYESFEAKSQEVLNTKEEIERSISNEIWERIPDAKLANVKLENYGEYDKPYIYSYRIKIPNYASVTGKRMFLQPNFFKYKVAPIFTSETRIHPLYFPKPWSENDEITFTLPKDYKIENYNARGVTDTDKIGMLTMNLDFEEKQNSIKFKRQFYFGKSGKTLYSTNIYVVFKQLFDKFNLADSRVVSLVKE